MIDKKWQDRWDAAGAFRAEDFSDKPKKYVLVEFPYPSGAGLHVGHPRSYTALDVVARRARMQGFNVLYPMGWDAFGLPTENFALKTGRPPAEITAENVATFKRQIKSLGLSFDWSREIDSTDPSYYKWTQWQFLQFFKAGLAYKAKTMINWCPKDKIGLANEEAAGGVCDRCGGPVEKREKEQWMIGITKYADRLLADLDIVNYLPKIRKQQEEWIGKSEGAEVVFALAGIPGQPDGAHSVTVFTTRPDTLFGATYIAISAELAQAWLNVGWQATDDVKKFVAEVLADERARETTREDVVEKKGIATGIFAINPVNGEKIPVWIANYVLGGVGTGAIMAVPAHDERDFEFANRFGLEIKQVVAEQVGERLPDATDRNAARAICIKDGKILIAFDTTMQEYILPGGGVDDGETAEQAVLREITEETGYKNIRITKNLGTIERNYYHAKKKNNWHSFDTGFVVELIDDEKKSVSEEEAEKHKLEWVSFDEAYEKIKSSPTFGTSSVFFDRIKNECELLFVDDGVNISSDFLNGLTTSDAKQKMIAWLEEKKVGARKTTYKLRDWVFSRQRYWGEPIPLVHCDACEQKKYQYVFIHGFTGSVDKNFFPWLKVKLEVAGHTVVAHDLPNASEPSVDEQVAFLEKNVTFTEDTIIIAHSLGTVVAQKLLPRLKTRVRKTILVDGFMNAKFRDHTRPAVENSCDWKFDPAAVRNATEELLLLGDETESIFKIENHREMAQFYKAAVQIVRPQDDHFTADQEPIILEVATISGWNPLSDAELPLTLPSVEKYEPTDTGESPLASIPEFVNTECPRCGAPAKRETDTMPNWAGSSWYFLRYLDAHNDTEFAAADKLKYWMPVDLYNGGMEHTVLHLLYSRFWNKFMYDCGYVPTPEPYARRVSHGLIMSEDGTKMSKSKGNVVNPDEIVQAQGADTLRVYEMFIGPFSEPAPWSTSGVSGVRRFLDRVMRLSEKIAPQESQEVTRGLHKMLKAVTEDYDRMSFNTAVAQYMTFVNTVYAAGAITRESLEIFARALNVAAPHVGEELWERAGGSSGLVCQQPWPAYDSALVQDEMFELVIQINGKVRDRVQAPSGASEEEIKALAFAQSRVTELLTGKTPTTVIVVPGRLVNIVV